MAVGDLAGAALRVAPERQVGPVLVRDEVVGGEDRGLVAVALQLELLDDLRRRVFLLEDQMRLYKDLIGKEDGAELFKMASELENLLGDTLLETNERFSLVISAVTNASALDTLAIGTLSNDERVRFAGFKSGVPMFWPGTLPPSTIATIKRWCGSPSRGD